MIKLDLRPDQTGTEPGTGHLPEQQPEASEPVRPSDSLVKLILAIVQKEDAGNLIDALTGKGYRATRIDATGGFLRRGNAMILIGVAASSVDAVLATIATNCSTRTEAVNFISPVVEVSQLPVIGAREVVVGGATVFVLGVARMERL